MDANAATPPRREEHSFLRIRRPRLLVVEDDPDMWRLVERAAREANPEVLIHWTTSADGARSALERYEFDAVLADFMLENSQSGWWLLGECQRLQPNARIALSSSLPLRSPEAIGCPFLKKPFGIQDCRTFVTRLLC
ncbi:MAG: hypothetical protein ACR2P8_03640 [Myxococcota bacterium]